MSGSGSLHSWNLEAPEEKSDSDWLHLEKSVREEDGAESLPASLEKQEQKSERIEDTKLGDVKEVTDGNQEEEEIEESNNSEEEGKGEEEKERASRETRLSSEEDGNKPEVEETSIGNSEDKENWIMEENRSIQMMKDLQEEPQQRDQEQEKEKTEVGPPHQNTAEDKQEPEVVLQPADSQSHANEEPPQKLSDEAEKRLSSPAPKVSSAVARFQSQVHSQGFQVNTSAKEPAENRTSELLQSREKVQTPANKSKKSSDEEEEPPMIKVSELKKRFEA